MHGKHNRWIPALGGSVFIPLTPAHSAGSNWLHPCNTCNYIWGLPLSCFQSWPTWLIKPPSGSGDAAQALLAVASCHRPPCFPSFYCLHSFLFATTLVLSWIIPLQSSTSRAFLLPQTSFFSLSSAHLSPVLWHRLKKELCASRK